MNKTIIKLGLASVLSISTSASTLTYSPGQISAPSYLLDNQEVKSTSIQLENEFNKHLMAIENIKTDIEMFLDENNEYVKGAFSNTGIESLEITNIKSNYRLHEILTNLVAKSWINTLKSFRITNSKIKKTGLQALVGVFPRLTQIRNLNLSCNELGDDEVQALVDHLPAQLHILDLDNNYIRADGAIALADALHRAPQLQTLNLGCNNIGDTGTIALANALSKSTQLKILVLNYNNIGDAGTITLADALSKSAQLKNLYLGCNDIGDAGAVALANDLPTQLHILTLFSNNIGEIGIKALKQRTRIQLNIR